ncbi:MAG: D-alanyl-D-alanine carboxypeptidase family protein [Pseudomonadota bacterium]
MHSLLKMIAAVATILCLMLKISLVMASAAFAGPYIVVDVESGQVINSERATDPWYPASITKLMTLYVTARAVREGRIGIHETLTVSKYASRTSPSKMGFKPGTLVTIDNAIKMLMVKSANDMAVALAEKVSGSEDAFVAEMNRTAREIGMTSSSFVNPHGLPARAQRVTARDMAVLGLALHREFPELEPLFGLAAIKFGKANLRSHNLLLEHYRGANGMKTGFTCSSGLTLVASAKRRGKTYVAVVLGERSSIDRAEQAAYLLERAFTGEKGRGFGTPLRAFNPRPTRETPVDLRPLVCQSPQKIRKFQIVVPAPKPGRKLFGKSRHTSPQRKDFGRNLGDRNHPQGALVTTPGRRSFRSHILQPRIARDIVPVYAGPYQGPRPTDLAIRLDKDAKTRLVARLPIPRERPAAGVLATLVEPKPLTPASATASAFAPVPSEPAANSPSLHEKALARAQAAERLKGGLAKTTSDPRVSFTQREAWLSPSQNGLYRPRPNPLR